MRRRIPGVTGGRAPFRIAPKDRLHLLFVVSRPTDAGSDRPLLTPAPAPISPGPTPTAATPTPRPNSGNLPPPREAGFFGRRRELWDIERWLAVPLGPSGCTRRITITGFGGQGKTALAQEAGRWLVRTGLFQAAVSVDYAQPQGAPVAVAIATIASVLGETLSDAAAATRALAATPTLAILDNLEALPPADLRALPPADLPCSEAGGSRLLLTTRSPDLDHPDYRPEGSHAHRHIPLAGLGSILAPEDALDWYAALTRLPPAPSIAPPSREALVGLFHRVDFHPLSIAVLAQQLKARTPADLGERLQAILAQPVPEAVVAEGTPRSLIASIRLSLDRLDSEQRRALRQLGVFEGGAMEDNLLAITGLDPDLAWPRLRAQLETAGLIRSEAIPGVVPPYLSFHPTLAPLLWAQLDPEAQARLAEAHRRRYHALAGYLYNADPKTPDQARAIARRELANLRAAVDRALKAGDPDAVSFVYSVNRFLHAFGQGREAAALTERAGQLGGKRGSQAWYQAESNRGEQLLAQGRADAAAQVFEDILTGLRDTRGEAPSGRRRCSVSAAASEPAAGRTGPRRAIGRASPWSRRWSRPTRSSAIAARCTRTWPMC